ncbi:MAG TPA: Trp biosynthesis-associated membrane protein [Pseudolysinimonas sp.]|nr:Trp biosynthesis-associated membrane protein [Pseudolysinimonas sp.]
MTPSRLRLLSLLSIVAVNAVLLLAWSQLWFTLTTDSLTLAVGGEVAGGALVALVLASFALVAALALAGRVFRVILGLLQALLGFCAVAVSVFALSDPVAASSTAISARTGISGLGPQHQLVSTVASTGWPVVAVCAGSLVLALGLLVVGTSGRWPVSGRRFDRTRAATADTRNDSTEADAVDTWDALSDGGDPTASR